MQSVLFACLFTALVAVASVSGAVIEWIGASGVNSDFATAANWSPAQVPGSDDSVLVHSGDSIRLTANVLFESLILESIGRDSPAAAFIADSPTAFAVSVGSLNVTSGRIAFQSTLGIRSACAMTDAHISAQTTITVTGGNQYCYLSGNVTFNAPQWQVDGTLVLATVSSRTGLDTYVSGSGNQTNSATARVVFLSTGTAPAVGATFASARPPAGNQKEWTALVGGTIEMSAAGQRVQLFATSSVVSATWTNPALSTLEVHAGEYLFNFGAGSNNVPQTIVTLEGVNLDVLGGGAAGLNFGVVEIYGDMQLPITNLATATHTFQELRVMTGTFQALNVVGSVDGSLGGDALIKVNVVKLVLQRKLLWDAVALTTTGTARLSFPMYLGLGSTWTLPASAQLTLDRYAGLWQASLSSTVNWAGKVLVTNETVVPLRGANPSGIGYRTPDGVIIDPLGTITFSGSMTLLDGTTLTFDSNIITLTGTSFVNCTTPRTHFHVRTYTQTWAATSAVVGPGLLTIESVTYPATVNFLQYPVVKVPDNVVLIRQAITFGSAVTLKSLQLRDGTALSLQGQLTADTVTIRGDSFYATSSNPTPAQGQHSRPALQSDFGCNQNAIPIVIKQLFVQQNLTRGDELELSRVALTITDHAEVSANVLLFCGSQLTIASTASAMFAPYRYVESDTPRIPVLKFSRSFVTSPPNLVLNYGTVTFGAGQFAAVNAFIDLGMGGLWRNTGPVSMFTIGVNGGAAYSSVTVVPPACFQGDSGAVIANPPLYTASLCNVTAPEPSAAAPRFGAGGFATSPLVVAGIAVIASAILATRP